MDKASFLWRPWPFLSLYTSDCEVMYSQKRTGKITFAQPSLAGIVSTPAPWLTGFTAVEVADSYEKEAGTTVWSVSWNAYSDGFYLDEMSGGQILETHIYVIGDSVNVNFILPSPDRLQSDGSPGIPIQYQFRARSELDPSTWISIYYASRLAPQGQIAPSISGITSTGCILGWNYWDYKDDRAVVWKIRRFSDDTVAASGDAFIGDDFVNVIGLSSGTTYYADVSVLSLRNGNAQEVTAEFSTMSSWTLPLISGLGLWLDADDPATITKDGFNKVSQWNDKSGNNRNFSQATVPKQPVFTTNIINGQPALVYSMGCGLIRNANLMGTLASSTAITLYTVASFSSNSDDWNLVVNNYFDETGANNVFRIHYGLKSGGVLTSSLYGGNTGIAFITNGPATAINTPYINGFVHGGSTVPSTMIVNGSRTAYTPGFNLQSSLSSATSAFVIGDIRSSARPCENISEVLMYDRALTLSEQTQIETYLKAKYSISY